MTSHRHTLRQRPGFTLVELLTVVAIIALLIGILLPSLTRARDQAKNVRTQAIIKAASDGLEMFQNDFGAYPDSEMRRDPISSWNDGNDTLYPPDMDPTIKNALSDDPIDGAFLNRQILTGSHWAARALIGPDFDGVDTAGGIMYQSPTSDTYYAYDYTTGNLIKKKISDNNYEQLADRKATYMENFDPFSLDGRPNLQIIPGSNNDFEPTGRFLLYDNTWKSPILYYRANPRARQPFCVRGNEQAVLPGSVSSDGVSLGANISNSGVYNLWDNALITGASIPTTSGDNVGTQILAGWNFSRGTLKHGLGFFGFYPGMERDPSGTTLVNIPDPGIEAIHNKPEEQVYDGVSFTEKFHDHGTGQSAGRAKAVNEERFIMISAGKDQIFGTDDDVTNFE